MTNSLRTVCVFAAASALAGAVFAQAPPPIPANAAPPPIPAATAAPATAATTRVTPPPAPAEVYAGPDDSEITVIRKDAETVEEVRVGGELRYVRVTPKGGKTYYLVPSGNGQTFNRMDSLGGSLSVPMWLLFSW
jgi:Protein of unknown function (DUF2782)